MAAWHKAAGLVHQWNFEKTVSITSRTVHFVSWYSVPDNQYPIKTYPNYPFISGRWQEAADPPGQHGVRRQGRRARHPAQSDARLRCRVQVRQLSESESKSMEFPPTLCVDDPLSAVYILLRQIAKLVSYVKC